MVDNRKKFDPFNTSHDTLIGTGQVVAGFYFFKGLGG